MKKLALYVAMLAGIGFMASCGGDETTTPTDSSTGKISSSQKQQLLDKVWYPTSSAGGIEHEFLSDGTLRLSLSLDGRWTWMNSGDTMDCIDNSKNRFMLIFESVSANAMSFKSSTDGFDRTYSFKDTE